MVYLGLAFAILVDHHDAGDPEIGGNLLVVSSESRSDMDNSGTVFSSDIVARDHPESFSFFNRSEPWNKLPVFYSHEVSTLEGAVKNLEGNELVAWFVVL